jgi:hypothetical protein
MVGTLPKNTLPRKKAANSLQEIPDRSAVFARYLPNPRLFLSSLLTALV